MVKMIIKGVVFSTIATFAGLTMTAESAQAQCDNGHVFLTPCNNSVSATLGASSIETVTITDYWFQGGYYNVWVSCGGIITSCSYPPGYVYLWNGWSENVDVNYSVSNSTPGTGYIYVTFDNGWDPPVSTTITVTVDPEVRSFNMTPSTSHGSYHNPAICAVSCFAATAAVSTVPYYTLDTPRSVGLVYNGDRAFPRPFIYADVSSSNVTYQVNQYEMSATITTPGGTSQLTFLNGEQTLYFSGNNSGGRLAAQFDGASYGTGVYPVTIQVIARYTDSGSLTQTSQINVVIVNDGDVNNYIAKGWTIAGLQRLYTVPGGGYLIVEGGGAAVYYPSYGVAATDHSVLSNSSGFYFRTYADKSQAVFYPDGTQYESNDRFGRGTAFVYDNGKLSLIRESMRNNAGADAWRLELEYDANGITAVREKKNGGVTGRSTSFSVNGSSQLTSVTDPDTYHTDFGYDGSSRLSTVTDRKGNTKSFGYDSFTWKLASETLPTIPVDNGSGGTNNQTPVVTYTPWHGQGVPRTSTASSPAAIGGSNTGSITDPMARTTTVIVNDYGQLSGVIDPVNRTTSFSYDGIKPSGVFRPDGSYENYYYGGGPFPLMRWVSGESVRNFAYNSYGQIDSVWGPNTRKQKFMYYGDRRLQHTWWPREPGQGYPFVSFWYDGSTGRISATDQSGRITNYSYESVTGNLSTRVAPGNRVTTVTFDIYGRDSTVTDPDLIKKTVFYDIMNRTTQDSLQNTDMVNRYAYDPLYLTDVTDPNNNVTHTDYNALGWPTDMRDANGLSVRYRYDKSGLKTSITNRRGDRVNYSYDAGGRLVSKSGDNTTLDQFEHTTNEQMAIAYNSIARDSVFIYPANKSDSSVTRVSGIRYRIFHGTMNNWKGTDSMTVISSNGVTFRHRYWNVDSLTGQLKRYQDGFNTFDFRYFANGDREKTIGSLGGERYDNHNTLHKLSRQTFANGNLNNTFERAYSYDGVGRVLTAFRGPGLSPTTVQQYFGYSAYRRLSSFSEITSCGLGNNPVYADTAYGWRYNCTGSETYRSYSYDAAGNRTGVGAGYTASYTTGNRITAFQYWSSGNNYTFEHDADGNITRKLNTTTGEDRRYYWTAENRLRRVELGSQNVDYEYDALGRPVRKYRNGSLDRTWIWSGDHLLSELDASGYRLVEYHYYPGTVDRPYAAVVGTTTPSAIRYIQQDEMGNVTGHYEAHSWGTAVNQTVYYPDPWGKPEIHTTADSRLFWKGLLWEGDIVGLYYMRNRWYDPETGRFMSEDPIGVAGGLNLYAFAGNDPINFMDSMGQDCKYILSGGSEEQSAPEGSKGSIGGTKVKCENGQWVDDTHELPGVNITAPRGGGGGVGGGVVTLTEIIMGGGGGGLPKDPPPAQKYAEAMKKVTKSNFRQCFEENTAWMQNAFAQAVGATGALGAISGPLLLKVGSGMVEQGTGSIELFRALQNPSSSLIENGIAQVNTGRTLTAIGRAGTYGSVAVAGFAAGYLLGTSILCAAQ